MKHKITLLLFSLTVTLLNAQRIKIGSINEVATPYTVLINQHQTLMDTVVIAHAGVKKAVITITDSTQVRTLSKGKCTEMMSFTFLQDGKIQKAEYSINHPKVKVSGNITYQYPEKYAILIGDHSVVSGVQNATDTYLYRYSSSGKLLHTKTSNESATPDTAAVAFSEENCLYSADGIMTSKSVWLHGQQTSGCRLSGQKKEEGIATLSYCSWFLGAPDSTCFTETSWYNSQGHIIKTVQLIGTDTVSVEKWNYDETGNLAYYSYLQDLDGSKIRNEMTITRNEKGLPTRVWYVENSNSIVFDFKWQ